MDKITKVLIAIAVIALGVIFVLSAPAEASELSDFNSALTQQNTTRGAKILDDMAYTYGGYDKMIIKMNYLASLPTVTIMSNTVRNHETGEDVLSGYWVVNRSV